MNWDQIEGKWHQFKGRIREQWGMFADDDLEVMAGRRDQFLGRLQERRGLNRTKAKINAKIDGEQPSFSQPW